MRIITVGIDLAKNGFAELGDLVGINECSVSLEAHGKKTKKQTFVPSHAIRKHRVRHA